MFFLIKILVKLFCLFRLKNLVVRLIVVVSTNIISLVGKNRDWAYSADEKIVVWAKKRIEKPLKLHYRLRVILIIFVILIYVSAILPDLQISNYLDDSLVDKVSTVKQTFQSWESKVSSGYLDYQPLFGKEEKIYIRIRKGSPKKIKVYEKVSKKAKVIKKTGTKNIEYLDEVKKANNKYWFKVRLEEDGIEGWILEDVVDKEQMGDLLG